jgi:hypothetical protein
MLECLSEIRDLKVLSSRNSAKGPLIYELSEILYAYDKFESLKKLRDEVVIGNLLPQASYETRRSIWNKLYWRYFKKCGAWIASSLSDALEEGKNSRNFLSQAYLYYVLRDRFTYLFVTHRLWDIWSGGSISIRTADVIDFLFDISDSFIEVTNWRESTRKKLALNTLRSFTEFGILKGKRRKVIQQPAISDEAVYHLLCILLSEGNRGNEIIEARDWRMFLWDKSNVSYRLNQLSLRGWIGFEKSGSTVMIDMKRNPEV